MQSRKARWQGELFIASPLESLVPDDHILKRVNAILDLRQTCGEPGTAELVKKSDLSP